MRLGACVGGVMLGVLSLAGVACDETTCGDGTVEVAGECVPLLPANCTGPGVRFVNGVCVPDFDEVCGPGTEADPDTGVCVSTGAVVDAGDTGGGDAGGDAGGDVADGGADAQDSAGEVVEFDPACDDDLVAGERVCIWGQVVNFLDGTPVPADADPPLQVQVKDLVQALGDPLTLLDETLIVAGGNFSLPGVDMAGEPPRQLILIVGEDEDTEQLEGSGTTWQRTISGLVGTTTAVDEHGDLTLQLLPRSAVVEWNAALGLNPPAPGIHIGGFFLVRVIDGDTDEPIEGATLAYDGGASVTINYFTDAEMTTFGGTATGPSGVAMLRGSSATDFCNAVADGYSSTGQVNCGVSPNRATINTIRMLEE